MSITSLHKFLTAPTDKTSQSTAVFWFALTLTFAAIYGLMGLQQAFSAEYVVQDDARQHVFWMQRFVDPQLFPGDLIADYFQAVAPAGYTGLYWLMAKVGIAPILLHKLLPFVMNLITTAYCFGVTMQLLPVAIAGCISSLLLNHYIWMRDDVISATAVAFVYPLFLAFLYYLLRGKLIATCISLALLGLFYPQGVFICGGILILRLVKWEKWRLHLSGNVQDYRFYGTGLVVALCVILFYALKSHGYGPVITPEEAKTLPEFLSGGKFRFFTNNPWDFWFSAQRSGILPRLGTVLPLYLSGLLPILLLFPAAFPLLSQDRQNPALQNLGLFLQITLASLGMFFISHALLFRLHLPSRYTEHSLRIVTAIAAGIAVTMIIDAVLSWGTAKGKKILPLTVAFLLLGVIIFEPTWLKRFPRTDYIVGKEPPIYEFFTTQPKDTLIASLAEEVNNIPSFSHRSILVGGEGYPVPYHKGYYSQMRQRTIDLIHAHYSPDVNEVQQFIQKYGIDFWLVEAGAFTPEYLMRDRWMMQYQPVANEAIASLQQGTIPALFSHLERCTVFQGKTWAILQASCLSRTQNN